jgi:hypothetical protein
MTRKEYINHKGGNLGLIIYEYYKEKASVNLVPDMNMFLMYLNMWCAQKGMGLGNLYQVAVRYYDVKFNITTVIGKDNEFIMCI